jgi:hypothetical protein
VFCPNCGQERVSEATKFCSRCGYLLTGTAELLARGGALTADAINTDNTPSPRSRGLRQGLFLIMLAIVLVPIIGILLRFAIGMPNPWPIGVILFLLGGGGFLRMAFALMFEAGKSQPQLGAGSGTAFLRAETITSPASHAELPPQHAQHAIDYTAPSAGRWLDTNDLQPTSVTENTTRHLEKDPD